MTRTFELTREAGLTRLAAVTTRLGYTYAAERNADPGPEVETSTSALSPYLRRRLITEEEVVGAAHASHGEAAEKFVSEVFWRTYFKGHLETHPAIWADYKRLVAQGEAELAASSGLRHSYERAIEGRTGIEGFDDWARELVEVGWLHNHTRMWFASIWIFTLRLPWALGAAFFLRHLLDGDPASNILSWRWVAGLHTRGKAYAATAHNVRRYTNGRYDPRGLNEDVIALDEEAIAPVVPILKADAMPTGEIGLLLHLDDLHPESLPLDRARVVQVAGLLAHVDEAGERVRAADKLAMDDALTRAAAHFGCPASLVTPGWEEGRAVVTAWAPVGPSADALPPCSRIRRTWDEAAWPHATRGYSGLRKAISRVLRQASVPD